MENGNYVHVLASMRVREMCARLHVCVCVCRRVDLYTCFQAPGRTLSCSVRGVFHLCSKQFYWNCIWRKGPAHTPLWFVAFFVGSLLFIHKLNPGLSLLCLPLSIRKLPERNTHPISFSQTRKKSGQAANGWYHVGTKFCQLVILRWQFVGNVPSWMWSCLLKCQPLLFVVWINVHAVGNLQMFSISSEMLTTVKRQVG